MEAWLETNHDESGGIPPYWLTGPSELPQKKNRWRICLDQLPTNSNALHQPLSGESHSMVSFHDSCSILLFHPVFIPSAALVV